MHYVGVVSASKAGKASGVVRFGLVEICPGILGSREMMYGTCSAPPRCAVQSRTVSIVSAPVPVVRVVPHGPGARCRNYGTYFSREQLECLQPLRSGSFYVTALSAVCR